ncbi:MULTISPECIES: D-lyxose/D-mannose family sugar isomerase [unclassified Mesorhizobium]|uniref:D-lyxose/D-mannose family sugar isomerase n=1 Tax=unclassified Mesorhizobium TaxID=325217 RepID=UPI000BB02F20|nr:MULTISPECIES: DUF6484 domain-containing protein [unclassified Mesorhizobium]MBZ9734245.1 DUF6484 domain-containing protein [Mesorhizobium sp. CA9]MBZ9766970.1 DUF6484 domain-containing protein [Mesorhizobium sp. CA6]MBZ9824526.1 DUF6484 domain-containing protein [Mesorhizobium sp. CA18]MBZ9829516.1 DUF6484 domain-containing protein [Mesorhizobium sp. CA2]MBZ9837215.1 DUF6484 domain-containing protein [Mesorhizobium sp. CA3]
MSEVMSRIDGVVIGLFLGFDDARPLVVFPGNPKEAALPARSLAELSSGMIGSEIALLFENGDPLKPLIVGRIVDPARKTAEGNQTDHHVVRDGETVKISAGERLELRCGKSVIIMEKDGHLTIRGTYLVSHASATNRIRGGSVNLN